MNEFDHFVDVKGIRWKVEFKNPCVTTCAFWTKPVNSYNDRIFANLGYENNILRVTNYDTGFTYEFGETYVSKGQLLTVPSERIKSYQTNRCHIMGFYIDCFHKMIGVYAWNIGKVDMNELQEEIAEDWTKYKYLGDDEI